MVIEDPSSALVSHVPSGDRSDSRHHFTNKTTNHDNNVYEEEDEEISNPESEVTETRKIDNTTPPEDAQTEATIPFWQKWIQLFRRRHGLILALTTAITFSLQSLFLDVLTETLDSFQVVFIHVPLFMICSMFLVLHGRVRPPTNYRLYLWLLGSGTAQSANTCLLALALSSLAVGDAVTIFYTSLVQVVFFSRVILKEPVRLFDIFFAFLALGGVVFIARPPFIFKTQYDSSASDGTLHGIIFALAGSSSNAAVAVVNRKLSTLGVNSYFCMFCNGTMVFLTSGVITFALQKWHWPTMQEWLFAVFAGIAYMCGHFSLFYALKTETATIVTVIATSEIVFVFVWQIIFLNELSFWTSYVGTILIVAACIGTTVKTKLPPSPQPTTPTSPPIQKTTPTSTSPQSQPSTPSTSSPSESSPNVQQSSM